MGKRRPGDFPPGSLESRVAMRAELQERSDTDVLIWTGLPRFFDGAPTIEAPDSIEHYQAKDGSIVEVIRREYAPGKFTAFINQVWKDGTVYHGECRLESLGDLEKTCRPIPLQPSIWDLGTQPDSERHNDGGERNRLNVSSEHEVAVRVSRSSGMSTSSYKPACCW